MSSEKEVSVLSSKKLVYMLSSELLPSENSASVYKNPQKYMCDPLNYQYANGHLQANNQCNQCHKCQYEKKA